MEKLNVTRKLTEAEVAELRTYKYKPGGDRLYWDRMAEIYADEPTVLERIEFEKQYLDSLDAIPYEYPCHWKTQKCYLDTVNDFNEAVGYTPEEKPEVEDCLLEEIAAKFGIDIDINKDGITSLEKYGPNGIKRQ